MNHSFRTIRLSLLVTVLVALAIVGLWLSPRELLLSEASRARRWPMLLGILLVLYVIRPFLLWPLSIFSVFTGYVFGPYLGLVIALLGTLLTSYPPFAVATYFGDETDYFDWLAVRGRSFVNETGELRGVIAARISPAPADAVSYSSGIAGVSTSAFAVGTVVGELPWALFYVLVGRSLHRFSVGAIGDTNTYLLLASALLAGALIARSVFRTLRNKTRESQDI